MRGVKILRCAQDDSLTRSSQRLRPWVAQRSFPFVPQGFGSHAQDDRAGGKPRMTAGMVDLVAVDEHEGAQRSFAALRMTVCCGMCTKNSVACVKILCCAQDDSLTRSS